MYTENHEAENGATMLQEAIGCEIRGMIDLVCDRDKVPLDDDQRAEISCAAAQFIIDLLTEK